MHDGPPRQPPAAAVQGNHWTSLTAGAQEEDPSLPRVSIVIPVRTVPRTLPWVLASLDAQRYPRELLEIVVVGWEGATPPASLTTPAGTTVATLPDPDRHVTSLGAARNRGIAHATGEVLVLLGAQTVAHPGLVDTHARWHRRARDLLVVGGLHHISPDELATDAAPDQDVRALEELEAPPVPWWEQLLEETEDLTAPGAERTRAIIGMNLSVRREHLATLGGFAEPALPLDEPMTAGARSMAAEHPAEPASWICEDRELGWRAINEGSLIVPERAARAWTPWPMLHADEPRPASTAERAWLAAHVPLEPLRPRRTGRALPLPRALVTVEAAGAEPASVLATVDAALTGDLGDVIVLVRTGEDPQGRALREILRGEPRALLDDATPPAAPLTVALETPVPMRHDSLSGLFADLVTSERAGVLRLTAPLEDAEEAPETTVVAWSRRAVRAAARVARDRMRSDQRAPSWEQVLALAEDLFGGGWESGSERGLGHGERWRPTAASERQLGALQRAQQREERLEGRLRKRERRIRRLERELEEAHAQAERAEERLARLEGRRVVRALRRVDRLRRGDA